MARSAPQHEGDVEIPGARRIPAKIGLPASPQELSFAPPLPTMEGDRAVRSSWFVASCSVLPWSESKTHGNNLVRMDRDANLMVGNGKRYAQGLFHQIRQ